MSDELTSTCPKCAAATAPDAKFCTECGASLPACDDDTHAALSSANLYRLRGEWQAAIDKCMFALALDEDCAPAHSLLGDIYREQGHTSEAVHWYKLALDLDPDNEADRAKLEGIIAHRPDDRRAGHDRRAEMIGTAKRVLLEAALAIGLLLLITAVWPMIFPERKSTEPGAAPPAQNPQVVHIPSTVPEGEPESEPPAPARQPIGLMSARENALLQAMNASQALTRRGLQVTGIAFDPRNRSAAITFTMPEPPREQRADAVVRGSLIVLREACSKSEDLELLTIRALHGDSSEVGFVADAQRNSVQSLDPATAEYSQLIGVLQNTWWAQ